MWASWVAYLSVLFAALPVVALLVALQVEHRGLRNPALEAGLILGTLPWLWAAFVPRGEGHRFALVPFQDLIGQIRFADTGFEQIVGNLLVFAALGALGPMRWPFGWDVVRLALGSSIVIEMAQWVLSIGRVSSVDDVLLNVAGAALGAALTRRWWAPDDGTVVQVRPSGPSAEPA